MDKLVVRGPEVSIQWNMERDDYISLTDIAKVKDSDNPRHIIQNRILFGFYLYNPVFIKTTGTQKAHAKLKCSVWTSYGANRKFGSACG